MRQGKHQHGFALLEALIAILIFSLGILGIVGMQAVAVKQSTDARYRAEAAQLAERLIGTMWAGDRTVSVLQARFNTCSSTSCSGYRDWFTDVSTTLPGVVAGTATAPAVTVDGAGVVTVSIFWRPPSEAADATPHRFDLTSQIR